VIYAIIMLLFKYTNYFPVLPKTTSRVTTTFKEAKMGRYSFIGATQNLSAAQVSQLHGNVNAGRDFSSANMAQNIQAMRNLGEAKKARATNLAGHKRLRPGNLSGSWFA
jgi:hypothetical protein